MSCRSLSRAVAVATVLTPLVATSVADASGRRCGGSPEVCFYAENAEAGMAAKAVGRIDVYTTNTDRDISDVAVTFFMVDGNGNAVKQFGFRRYAKLPKASRPISQAFQVVAKPQIYCDKWTGRATPVGFSQPFEQACSTWPAGMRLSARFSGGVNVDLRSPDQTLLIK